MKSKNRNVQLPDSWLKYLADDFSDQYMKDLKNFLLKEVESGEEVYPHGSLIFSAFHHTPLDQIKVVILGQDPYHGPGQAHGLSFSVPEGIPIPPSLKNIYKELSSDLSVLPPNSGYLKKWAQQGVFLLNSVLSVRRAQAASHQGKGWERFTDKVIDVINEHTNATVFILWGSYAQRKGEKICQKKHLVLSAPHPSPLSAHRGFFGSKPFSKTNKFLKKNGKRPIEWIENQEEMVSL